MQQYLPEGFTPQTHSTWDYGTLQKAAACGEPVQATVLYCDDALDLHIDLFPYEGLIPCGEVSLAGREGKLQEKMITQLVGRPVFFRVIGRLPDGRWLLSRAEAQRQAQTQILGSLSLGDVIPAVVTGLAPYGAFCDIGCGLPALLGIENISVARVSHAKERLRVGQKLFVVVAAIDRQLCRITLSHKELLGTWKENAEQFLPGQTVPGTVRAVKPYGVFVELTPNLSGLAEPSELYHIGDRVSVFIKSILPQRRKIKLTILDKWNGITLPAALHYFITSGNVAGWDYATF